MKLIYNMICLIWIGTAFAQNPNRLFVKAVQQSHDLKVQVTDGHYIIKPYNQNIIETTFYPNGTISQPASHAVVMQPTKVKSKLKQTTNSINYQAGDFKVQIQKQPFKITYFLNEKYLVSEKLGYIKTDSTQQVQMNLQPHEILYGAGARALGMNRRGKRLPLYNRAHYGYETYSEQMNFAMPMVISNKGYMLHFDNAPIGFLDLDSQQNNTLTYETISGRTTYQVIAANTWQEINNQYAQLTGKQPLIPRWALGNFSSRFGYHSQNEVEETIKKFKQEKIPVDAIILDLYWFGKEIKGTMGNLKADKDSFPDFNGMINRLNNQNIKTILITEPFILSTSNRWQEAVKQEILATDSLGKPAQYEFYFGNTGIIDLYKPKAQDWFWNIYKGLANQGIAGFWGDLGEPEVHPEWVQHHTGTANQVHNIYGHDWAGLIFKGYQKDFPNQRPFILMRAGYSGSQRYGMIPWSGDVNRTWGGLQSQPEIALQMGMQGMGYMHSDLGGFAGNNLDDELYVRWLQYGVFNPIFRPHAQEDVPSEPVYRNQPAKQLAKQAIELRYKMLPYNYHLSYENHAFGWPLMRPLFYEEPQNQQLYTMANNYLWGKDFLVAPILKPNQTEVEVYFPKTANWYDFYTGKQYQGNQQLKIPTKEYHIPTFVRGGAIVPMSKPIQNTAEYDLDDMEIHWFFDEDVNQTNQSIYHDNGLKNNPIQNKDSFFIHVKVKSKTKSHKIQISSTQTNPKSITTKLVIHHIKNQPKWIKIGRQKIKFKFDSKQNKIQFSVPWKGKETIKIKV